LARHRAVVLSEGPRRVLLEPGAKELLLQLGLRQKALGFADELDEHEGLAGDRLVAGGDRG
jgi:hypothetical protein